MSWFSKFFGGLKQSSEARQQEKPQAFPAWLHQQGDDISIQDALDEFIDTYISFEQIDDAQKDLAKQRAEVELLEQLATKYGESMSPEFGDLLSNKKFVLEKREGLIQMKCESQKAIQEARRRTNSSNQPPNPI